MVIAIITVNIIIIVTIDGNCNDDIEKTILFFAVLCRLGILFYLNFILLYINIIFLFCFHFLFFLQMVYKYCTIYDIKQNGCSNISTCEIMEGGKQV